MAANVSERQCRPWLGELHVPEIQALLKTLYPFVDVAGATEGKSRGTRGLR
jgi:hypothetical protein